MSHLSLTILAVMAVLLIGAAGVSGATILGGGDGDSPESGGGVTSGPVLNLAVRGKGRIDGGGSIRCAKSDCRQKVRRGAAVLLRPTPALGSQFSRWRGACQGRAACRVVVNRYTRIVAHFTRVTDPRNVTVRVAGRGTVVSYPAGIRCGKDDECQATFKRSSDLKLTATAARGHRFTGWTGACRGEGRCDITDNVRTVAVVARFIEDDDARSLTVVPRGAGIGRVVSRPSGIDCGEACTASFERGSRVALVAIAQKGSSFPGWKDPACATAGDTCTVTLTRSRDIAVRFDKATDPEPGDRRHELRVFIRGPGTITSEPGGLESCRSSCTATFREGEVELAASTPEGYRTEWRGACAGTGGDRCVVLLDEPLSVVVSFTRTPTPQPPAPQPPPPTAAPTTYTLSTGKIGTPGGAIEPDCSAECTYQAGEQVVVSAVNGDDSLFYRWVTGCPATPESPTCTVTMNSDRRMVAEFGLG